MNTLDKSTEQLIEEAGKKLSKAFKIGTKQGFTPEQVLMLNEVYRDVTCIFEDSMNTISTKSAESCKNRR